MIWPLKHRKGEADKKGGEEKLDCVKLYRSQLKNLHGIVIDLDVTAQALKQPNAPLLLILSIKQHLVLFR
jgi:hypothetical protein